MAHTCYLVAVPAGISQDKTSGMQITAGKCHRGMQSHGCPQSCQMDSSQPRSSVKQRTQQALPASRPGRHGPRRGDAGLVGHDVGVIAAHEVASGNAGLLLLQHCVQMLLPCRTAYLHKHQALGVQAESHLWPGHKKMWPHQKAQTVQMGPEEAAQLSSVGGTAGSDSVKPVLHMLCYVWLKQIRHSSCLDTHGRQSTI